jgi:hypothetical protein
VKKIAAAFILAAPLVIMGVPSTAVAAQTCVDKVLDPIIQLPIRVCVDVPGVPTVPPLPGLPSGPIVVPPITPPSIPSTPSRPAPPAVPSTPLSPASPVVPVEPSAPDSPATGASHSTTEQKPSKVHLTPTPSDDAERHFQELAFPFAFMLALFTVLFGGYQIFSFAATRREKKKLAELEKV